MLLHPSQPAGLSPALANVPVELFREIVTQLNPGSDRTSLRSLCLVSQTLRDEAERHLYQRLSASQPREVALLCDLLAREPRIAALVGELTVVTTDVPRVELGDEQVALLVQDDGDVEAVDWDLVDFYSREGALRYWRTVARALRALPNLHTLTLAGDRALGLAWVLAGTQFRLRRFCGYMAFDGFLQRFLYEQTPSLADLELLTDGTWTGDAVLGLDHVAVMRVCLLDLDLAAHLISGRPVTHLQVTTAALHDSEIAELAREWRGSTGPVRAFTVDFGDDWAEPATIRVIAEAFPRLRLLGIVPLEAEEVRAAAGEWARSGVLDVNTSLSALGALANLRTLLINNREPANEIVPQEQFEIANYIRSANPSIRTIGYVRYAPPPPPPPLLNAPTLGGAQDAECSTPLQVVLTSQLVADLYRFTPAPTAGAGGGGGAGAYGGYGYGYGGAAASKGRWEFVSGADVEEVWYGAGSSEDQ